MIKRPHLGFVLGLVLIIFVLPTNQAMADVAPPHPPIGSDISPGDEITQVRMESEYVVLSIHSDPDYMWGRADITATFNMLNTGDEDEYLRVRYPLHHNLEELEVFESTDDCGVYPGTPVKDLHVWVDDKPVAVDIQYETTIDYEASNREERDIYMDIPCWGHFNVYFPSQQLVTIEVSYHVSGYERGGGGTTFDYLIGTGSGWKDTIESATIVARFPYPVSNLNVNYCFPESCKIADWEVIWNFEDFEPEGLVGLNTVDPKIWDQVIIEQKRLEINDQDGEAWGRLAKAYKDSLKERKGHIVINDEYDEEVFDLSYFTYQEATRLLTDDPGWHFGLADLACSYIGSYRSLDEDRTQIMLETCGEEIDFLLALDPDDPFFVDWQEYISYFQTTYQRALSSYEDPGPSSDQLIQTSQAEWSATITYYPPDTTSTPIVYIPPLTLTALASTQTPSIIDVTPGPEVIEETVESKHILQSQSSRNVLLISGGALFGVGLSALIYILVKAQKREK